MERRIHAMRKLYRKKFNRIASRVGLIALCIFFSGVTIKKVADYFFPTPQAVQQRPMVLTVPTFDLRVYCKEIAASVLPDMKKDVYDRCMNLESEAYFAIRSMWDDLSDKSKEKCIKMVRPGDGSYFLLRDCFINEKKNDGYTVRNHF
ncbi:hypothetical protein [Bartonella sp. CB175]|uniref:hypothetical protein n=1 Tax=Bartonella sp. CB175 TaxID=3112256 RepID=UPI00300DBF46